MSKSPSPELLETATSAQQQPIMSANADNRVLKLPEQVLEVENLPADESIFADAASQSEPALTTNTSDIPNRTLPAQQKATENSAASKTLTSQGNHYALVISKDSHTDPLVIDEYRISYEGTPLLAMPKATASHLPALHPGTTANTPHNSINPHLSMTDPILSTDPTPNTEDTPPAPTVDDEPSTPAVIAEPSTPAVIAEPNTPTVIAEPSTPTVIAEPNTPTVIAEPNTPAAIAEPSTPTVDLDVETTPVDSEPTVITPTSPEAEIISDVEISPETSPLTNGRSYTVAQLLNPSNLAGALIDYFILPTTTNKPNNSHHEIVIDTGDTMKKPSFFSTSLLNPSNAAAAFTQTVSEYLKELNTAELLPSAPLASEPMSATPAAPTAISSYGASLMNPFVAGQALIDVSHDFYQHLFIKPPVQLELNAAELLPSAPLSASEPMSATPAASPLLSSYGTSLMNPFVAGQALIDASHDFYQHLFIKPPVQLEQIDTLEKQLATKNEFLADLQTRIDAISVQITETKTLLEKNIQQALNSYSILEDSKLGMHNLLDTFAPDGPWAKFKEGFTAAWAKINPAEVTAYLKGITPKTSPSEVDWLLTHLAEYETKLAQATQNAQKIANQDAAQLSGQEVNLFSETKEILQSEKQHLTELEKAREEAALVFNTQNAQYHTQVFYDFSKSAEYKNTKFDLDKASANYESALADYTRLNEAIGTVETLQSLHITAQSATQHCLDIQTNLSEWQMSKETLNNLNSEKATLNYSITQDASDLTYFKNLYEAQNRPADEGPSLLENSWSVFKTLAQSPSLMAQDVENSMVLAPTLSQTLLSYAQPVLIAIPESTSIGEAIPTVLPLEQTRAPSLVETLTSYGTNLFSAINPSHLADKLLANPIQDLPLQKITEATAPTTDVASFLGAQKAAKAPLKLEDVLMNPDFFAQKVSAAVHLDQHHNYHHTLSEMTQQYKHSEHLYHLSEKQFAQAKMDYDLAVKTLAECQMEVALLENPKSQGQFTSSFNGPITQMVEYFTWSNKKVDSIETAQLNRDNSQAIFDIKLKAINKDYALNENATSFKAVHDNLIAKMKHASNETEKTKLANDLKVVDNMAHDLATWDKLLAAYKNQEITHQQLTQAEKQHTVAHEQFEHNENLLNKLYAEKPDSVAPLIAEPHHHHYLHASLPSFEKLGDDCCKQHPHLEGF